MRDRKQIREAIEGATAVTGGWDSPPTWGQLADVLTVLLAPAAKVGDEFSDAEIEEIAQEWRAWWKRKTGAFLALDDKGLRCSIRQFSAGEDGSWSAEFKEIVRTKAAEIRARKAAPSPDAPRDDLRERAIEVVADGKEINLHHVLDDMERSPLGEMARIVAAVERSLREESARHEGVSLDDDALGMLVKSEFPDDHPAPTTIGAIRALLLDEARAGEAAEALRDEVARASSPPSPLPDPFRAPWCCAAHPGGEVTCARSEHHDGSHVALDERSRPVAVWEDEAPSSPPEVPGVLAVVEVDVGQEADREGMEWKEVRPGSIAVRDAAPHRVTIAVLTGSLAAIVERHGAREAYKAHAADPDSMCGCEFKASTGEPDPWAKCEEGQRLAAAVKP